MGMIRQAMRLIFRQERAPERTLQAPVIGNDVLTIDAAQPMLAWRDNQDWIKGLEFAATLQLRTPLRVLRRHGEQHTDLSKDPDPIAREMWEGIWLPLTKTFRELGLDVDEFPDGTFASDAGQVKADEYLPFLIAVREIVELHEPIDSRVAKLRNMLQNERWRHFVDANGGIEAIADHFFPRFVSTIPKIGSAVAEELFRRGLATPDAIAAAGDEDLASIKGVGPAKLAAIRSYCASQLHDRSVDRKETVIR